MRNYKKEIVLFLTILIVVLILPSLTSAKFFDIWDTITGRAPTQTASISITVGNNAPIIGNVTLDMADSVSIIESGNKTFLFSFVATDAETTGDYIGKKMLISGGPGSSGGPIVNGRGQVLGIIQRGYDCNNTVIIDNGKRCSIHNPGTAYFMPIDMIRGLLLKAIEEKSLTLEGF